MSLAFLARKVLYSCQIVPALPVHPGPASEGIRLLLLRLPQGLRMFSRSALLVPYQYEIYLFTYLWKILLD